MKAFIMKQPSRNSLFKPFSLSSAVALSALSLNTLSLSVLAAPPDSGSLLREELRRDQPTVPAMPPKPETTKSAKPAAPKAGATMTIRGFRIVGLSSLPEQEAQAVLVSTLGEGRSMDDLHAAAKRLEQWLRQKGLMLARAWIPAQEIRDGVVEIRVVEGRMEGIDIKKTPETRLSDDILKSTLSGAQAEGSSLSGEKIERGLLLLNDLPGISARAVLVPGKEAETTRVLLETAQGPMLGGQVELDNTGSRYTGQWRLGGSVELKDPYGIGDEWSVKTALTEGSAFARLGYTVPLGSSGLKGGLQWIESRYRLCCGAPASQWGMKGEARSLSASLRYPLIRTRLNNLWLSGSLAERRFEDKAPGLTDTVRKTESFSLGLQGDWSQTEGLGAYTNYGVQWTNGQVRDQNAANILTKGHYDKWTGQIAHLQRVLANSAVYVAFSGQMASKNLDSSEKFVLGGSQGVRAYPTGEGSGDEGWLMNLEWRQEFSREVRMSFFVDHGRVRQNRRTWTGWNAFQPGLPNEYALSGAGLSVVWLPVTNAQITATLAGRIGKNPARDLLGKDSDGHANRLRLWMQGTWFF